MNELPQAPLNQLLSTYGNQLCEEQQRCEALLRDTFPSYPREVSLLVNALKQGVPQELLASHNKIPFDVTRNRLARKLAENLFVQDQAAEWVVDAWSEALGVKQTINRPMTTMQPPELSGPSGGQPNYGQGQWSNSPPSGGAYNPTVVSPASSGNPGTPGSAPTAVNPGSNSGNYNNPANYNNPGNYGTPAPNYNTPNYGNPGNPGTPANYGGANVMVQPYSGTPAVWIWQIVYCILGALFCGFFVLIGMGMMIAPGSGTSTSTPQDTVAAGLVFVICGIIPMILFGIAPFLPKRPWAWIYHLILICLTFGGCCMVFGIPLMIFWIKPDTRAFFNMQNS